MSDFLTYLAGIDTSNLPTWAAVTVTAGIAVVHGVKLLKSWDKEGDLGNDEKDFRKDLMAEAKLAKERASHAYTLLNEAVAKLATIEAELKIAKSDLERAHKELARMARACPDGLLRCGVQFQPEGGAQ